MSNGEQQLDAAVGGVAAPAAIAVQWRRYGHNRLYVSERDGTKIGWRDLATGEDHLDVTDRVDAYRDAVARWTTLTPETDPPVADTAGADEPLVEDLSARLPGALAREQATTLKQAAPVRTFVARVLGVHTDERAWRIGADGEEKVATQLDKLARKDPRWRSVHSVPVGANGADIDHVVVGPGGVFTLNSKPHPGAKVWVGGNTLLVNGAFHPYVRNSRHEAARAAKLLTAACGFPVAVTGIVVPVGAEDVTIKAQPKDVRVVNRMRLVAWLRKQPPALDEVGIGVIYRAARVSTTWRQ